MNVRIEHIPAHKGEYNLCSSIKIAIEVLRILRSWTYLLVAYNVLPTR